jgi:predicted nucleotidyltransferase
VTARDKTRGQLQAMKDEPAQKYHVSYLGLFGSITRSGFDEENSDVNILVEFSQPVGIEFVDLAEYLEQVLQRKVDLVSRNGIKFTFVPHMLESLKKV